MKTINNRLDNLSFIETETSLLPLDVDTTFSVRWIVMTSIRFPTAAVKKFSKLKGWVLVLVADVSTPTNWSHPNCVFLSIDSQKKLLFETYNIITYQHYGRKALGYLYAIRHGAQIIYEANDNSEVIEGIEEQVLSLQEISTPKKTYYLPPKSQLLNSFSSISSFDTEVSGIPSNQTTVDSSTGEEQITVNPYSYFGQNTMWPRGYPLRLIQEHRIVYVTTSNVRPLIQQGLINGDPDVDILFRLMRSNRQKKLNIQFQNQPPVAVSHGLFVPFNSQNTLFHYDAFWALWMPITTSIQVSDIWRGYFTQRLLWELEPQAALTFHSASVVRQEDLHDYLGEFEHELQLYKQSEQLILFLRKWTCSKGGTYLKGDRDCTIFLNKIFFLAIDMAEANFWKMRDAWLCRSFLIDLIKNGYQHRIKHRMSVMQPENTHQNKNSMSQKSAVINLPVEDFTRILEIKNNSTIHSNNHHRVFDNGFVSPRVAVCVSGQPRTLNMVIPAKLDPMTVDQKVYQEGSTWRKNVDMNQKTAANIQNMLLDRLPAYDIFMFVSTREKHHREPRINDISICEPFRPRSSTNSLFCSVVKEIDVTNPSTNLTLFKTFFYSKNKELQQSLLQQLDGLSQCNAMRKKYSQESGTRYTHWIRLRPDSVFLEPFPNITTMRFTDEITNQSIITYALKTKCCCGNEDWFGVGTIETMDAYFDRLNILQNFKSETVWTAEIFAQYALNITVNAKLIDNNPMVQVCLYKPQDRISPGTP